MTYASKSDNDMHTAVIRLKYADMHFQFNAGFCMD